ncbi:hypothetical protein, partial [Methylomonas albis]
CLRGSKLKCFVLRKWADTTKLSPWCSIPLNFSKSRKPN